MLIPESPPLTLNGTGAVILMTHKDDGEFTRLAFLHAHTARIPPFLERVKPWVDQQLCSFLDVKSYFPKRRTWTLLENEKV